MFGVERYDIARIGYKKGSVDISVFSANVNRVCIV